MKPKDAIETLGELHLVDEGRDAIHLAVISVIALEELKPGTRIAVGSGKAWARSEEAVGIVDPFLPIPVVHGDRFWCILNPRTITSLRHVWSHPCFPVELLANAQIRRPTPTAPVETDIVKSAAHRIRELAADLDCSVGRLMGGAAEYLESGDNLHFGFDLDYDWPHEDFWRCYEIVSGTVVEEDKKTYFFRCSC